MNFTFWVHLPTWLLMTFDLGIWLLTAWTYKGFQTKFGSNRTSNFSNEATFTFSAYLTTWPQITFDLDMWHLTSSTNEGSHVAPMTQLWLKSPVEIHQSMWWKVEPNVNLFSQLQATVEKSDPCLSFLLKQATQKVGCHGYLQTREFTKWRTR